MEVDLFTVFFVLFIIFVPFFKSLFKRVLLFSESVMNYKKNSATDFRKLEKNANAYFRYLMQNIRLKISKCE